MSKIYDFENVEPRSVLKWFKKICSVPHGSFKEKALSNLLKKELEQAGCQVKQLSSDALYIYCKATFGHDNWPSTLLQGHMDMVLVKDEGVNIDLDKEPIKAYYDTEKQWIKAEGTTLGADNGIAIAMFMEILTNPNIEHGPIEGLFTVGEEVDTAVCMNSIPANLLKSKYYINVDGCYDDTIVYASAGGFLIRYKLPLNFKKSDSKLSTYEINLQQFAGGHSALAIHEPHINPIIFACKTLLYCLDKRIKNNLVSIDGGFAYNAIPTWCKLVIQATPEDASEIEKIFIDNFETYKIVVQNYEKTGKISFSEIKNVSKSLSCEDSANIYSFFTYAPNDMIVPNNNGHCMFNSSNIGLVKTEKDYIDGGFLARSFYHPDLLLLVNQLEVYAKRNGASDVQTKESCSSWLVEDPANSFLINLWKSNYKKIVGSNPYVFPTPGGLEVSEICKKNKKMTPNAICVGPTIFKEHSTLENCPTKSIDRIWNILLLTLKDLNK